MAETAHNTATGTVRPPLDAEANALVAAADEHKLRYRAGSRGLGAAGLPDADPHWYCSCGGWVKARSVSGRPMRPAAERLHKAHVDGAARVTQTADNTAYVRCPNSNRHWFRAYGVVGLPAPTCTRCGAPNPKITDQQRREWDDYWRATHPERVSA